MKKKILPYFLLAPMMLIMGVLVFYPIITTFSYSLKHWKLTSPGDIRYIGLKNYISILQSDSFQYSMQNTVFILIFVIVFTVLIGYLISLYLNLNVKCAGVLLAIAIMPWALPPFVNGVLWKFVFFSGYGFLNKLLIAIGLIDAPIQFLASRWTLLVVISVVVVWRSVPFMALVCLAGRQSIPADIYEAAKIDGGTTGSVFRYITFPLMKPFLALGITSTSVTAFNVFDEIVALSGYSDLGKNILMDSYLTTFTFLNFGKGSAMTYIVLFFAMILGIFYLRNLNKEVDY